MPPVVSTPADHWPTHRGTSTSCDSSIHAYRPIDQPGCLFYAPASDGRQPVDGGTRTGRTASVHQQADACRSPWEFRDKVFQFTTPSAR